MFDARQVEEMSYVYHDRLARKLGISGRMPQVVAKEAEASHIRKLAAELDESIRRKKSNLFEAFNLPLPKNIVGSDALAKVGSPSYYDIKNHRIVSTLYSDKSSVKRFFSEIGANPNSLNIDATIRERAAMIPLSVSECVGLALRAESIGKAGTDSEIDSVVLTHKNGFFGGTKGKMMFDYEKLTKPESRSLVRKGKYELFEVVDVGNIFGSISMYECDRELSGTKYALNLSNEMYNGDKMLDEANKEMAYGILELNSPLKLTSDLQAAMKLARGRTKRNVALCAQKYNKDARDFRENHVYGGNSMFRQPSIDVFKKIFNASSYVDVNGNLENQMPLPF